VFKSASVVAKTLPFVVEIGSPFNLSSNGANITATLCYDNESNMDFKAVSFVSTPPMCCKMFVSEDGNTATAGKFVHEHFVCERILIYM
jgi:hypothetical protein